MIRHGAPAGARREAPRDFIGLVQRDVDAVHGALDLHGGELVVEIRRQRCVRGHRCPVMGGGKLGMQLPPQIHQQLARIFTPKQSMIENFHQPHRPAVGQGKLRCDHHGNAGFVQRVSDAGAGAGD